MYYKSNLAFVDDAFYNSKENKLFASNLDIPIAEIDHLLIKVKRILVLRENVLASGMDVYDIEKVSSIINSALRRWYIVWRRRIKNTRRRVTRNH